MAELIVDAAAVAGPPVPGTVVTVALTDADGRSVAGRTTDEVIVQVSTARLDADGRATFQLVPNADITPANTYYTVTIGQGRNADAFLIEKGAGDENLVDCEVSSPAALGSAATLNSLADVDTSGVADGDALVYDDSTETWVPGAGGGGGATGPAGGVLSGTYPDPGFAADMATQAELNAAIAALSTVYQPLDSDLTAIAALSTTAYGRALLALADAAAGRTALGLGSLATLSTVSSSEITDGTIVNGDISASAAIALSKLATDPLARANHTGTQAASTISDFAETARDTIGTALTEGEGIDITVNDGADTITIAAEDASDTNKGVVELATTAETTTGTDTARAVTPAGLRGVVLPMRDTASGITYFTPAGARAGSIALGSAAGVLLVVPIWLEARTYTRIGLYYYNVGTATLRLGVWNIDADGSPGTVALDAGTVTCTAGDGVVRKEATISWTPTAGWCWLGMLVDAYTSTPTMMAMSGAAGMQLLPGYRSGGDSNNAHGLTRTGVTTGSLGTWGASGSSASVAATAPMLYVRT